MGRTPASAAGPLAGFSRARRWIVRRDSGSRGNRADEGVRPTPSAAVVPGRRGSQAAARAYPAPAPNRRREKRRVKKQVQTDERKQSNNVPNLSIVWLQQRVSRLKKELGETSEPRQERHYKNGNDKGDGYDRCAPGRSQRDSPPPFRLLGAASPPRTRPGTATSSRATPTPWAAPLPAAAGTAPWPSR